MTRLETQRLLLADWQPQDWLAFRPIATDPDVMRHIGTGEPWPDARIQSFVRLQIEQSGRLGFCLWKLLPRAPEASGAPIGFCGLQPLSGTPDIEIGWWLAKACWGRGLATEAATAVLRFGFEHIGLNRIVAIAQPANRASVRIMEKLGMHFECDLIRSQIPVVLYTINHPARQGPEPVFRPA
jgi:RimJ/RimL family protein N-acetyltransferase